MACFGFLWVYIFFERLLWLQWPIVHVLMMYHHFCNGNTMILQRLSVNVEIFHLEWPTKRCLESNNYTFLQILLSRNNVNVASDKCLAKNEWLSILRRNNLNKTTKPHNILMRMLYQQQITISLCDIKASLFRCKEKMVWRQC